MFDKIKFCIANHAATLLATIGAAVLSVHLITVVDYPASWFDEIEILEIGRFSVFEQFPDWTVLLHPGSGDTLNPMAPMFHYLAGAIQEALYRLTGSFVPSRVFFLLSLPVAALLLFRWLTTKGIPVAAAFCAALFFLLDPNTTICAHWYRPDLWTTSCALGAMILLAETRGDATGRRPAACFAAGALSAVMLFLWITSMLLLPLIGWEAILSARPRQSDSAGSWANAALRDSLPFIAGGLLAATIILIPLYPHVSAIIAQYAEHSELGGGVNLFGGLARRFADFIKIAARSPFVWTTALGGILLARRFALHVVVFFGLCALMLATRVYHLRMIQLTPFLFLFAALTFAWAFGRGGRVFRLCRTLLLAGAALGYFGLSVLALNYAALPGGNTFAGLTEKLKTALPMKSPRVYLYDAEHELYYSGRALGWRMYAYSPRNLVFDASKTAGLLDKVDAVVITATAEQPTPEEMKTLADHGLSQTASVAMPPPTGSALRHRLANLFYAHGYPSCAIFTRTP